MRTQAPRPRVRRLALTFAFWLLLAGVLSGALMWLVANTAALLSLHVPPPLGLSDARWATWRLILRYQWPHPAMAFARAAQRAQLPGPAGFLAAIALLTTLAGLVAGACLRRARRLGVGSSLGQSGLGRWLRDSGHIHTATWASPRDLRRLWVPSPVQGRPYLGRIGRAPARMLAAEREVQVLVVAPPRSGKSTGYAIPWLLDHRGHALVLSTKRDPITRRDVYNATVAQRQRLGRVWVYDPLGGEPTCSFSPLSAAGTWERALRTATALSSAARSGPETAASEFWDGEASVLLAPLLHAAALADGSMGTVLEWLDKRDFARPERQLEDTGAYAAAAQLIGVLARDPRNRETTIMSATNLLRAYRYPRVARATPDELTPDAFFADGPANTAYVIAAAHHQRDLQPIILALVSAIYETAIEHSRAHGPFDPPLYLILDEAGTIAPVRDLAAWKSQCGDHGITIATSWQSIAQIDHRYGRAERDAILAASTAQVFIPPIADPTTTSYLNELLGQEAVAHVSRNRGLQPNENLTVSQQPIVQPQSLRQLPSGNSLLVYRDLPPATVRAPGWYEDPRHAPYRRSLRLRETST